MKYTEEIHENSSKDGECISSEKMTETDARKSTESQKKSEMPRVCVGDIHFLQNI